VVKLVLGDQLDHLDLEEHQEMLEHLGHKEKLAQGVQLVLLGH